MEIRFVTLPIFTAFILIKLGIVSASNVNKVQGNNANYGVYVRAILYEKTKPYNELFYFEK